MCPLGARGANSDYNRLKLQQATQNRKTAQRYFPGKGEVYLIVLARRAGSEARAREQHADRPQRRVPHPTAHDRRARLRRARKRCQHMGPSAGPRLVRCPSHRRAVCRRAETAVEQAGDPGRLPRRPPRRFRRGERACADSGDSGERKPSAEGERRCVAAAVWSGISPMARVHGRARRPGGCRRSALRTLPRRGVPPL